MKHITIMGTYKRLPTQKPKPVNKFATNLDFAYHFLEHNWRAVLAGIGALAIVVSAVLLISFYFSSKDDKAKLLYYQAAKLPAGTDETMAAFQKVINERPSSGVAQISRLKIADILYAKGDHDKAEEVLTPLAKVSNSLVRTLGLENIAANKLAKGDAKTAAEVYIKAYSDVKNPARGMSYFNAGLAYKEAGNIDEAKKIFETLSNEDTDYSTPDLREKSKEQLIWIAAKQ